MFPVPLVLQSIHIDGVVLIGCKAPLHVPKSMNYSWLVFLLFLLLGVELLSHNLPHERLGEFLALLGLEELLALGLALDVIRWVRVDFVEDVLHESFRSAIA